MLGATLVAGVTAAGAVHYHELPNLIGFSGTSLWTDPEALCAFVSSAAAVFVGAASATGTHEAPLPWGPRLALLVTWLGLTGVLLACWWSAVLYFALLLAPSHAWGGIGLALSIRRWQDERHRADVAARMQDRT